MGNQWNPEPDSAETLTEGAWRFDPFRRVQVWVPGGPSQPALFEEVDDAA